MGCIWIVMHMQIRPEASVHLLNHPLPLEWTGAEKSWNPARRPSLDADVVTLGPRPFGSGLVANGLYVPTYQYFSVPLLQKALKTKPLESARISGPFM